MSKPQPLRAALAHRMTGRARLNLELSGDPELDAGALERFVHALASHPAVEETRVNPRARSLLISHRGELLPILHDCEARGLLSLELAPQRAAPMSLGRLKRAIDAGDARLLDATRDGVGLAGVAFVALTAAGIWQALNGQLLPAGTTLFQYALGAMQWGAGREAPTPTTTVQS